MIALARAWDEATVTDANYRLNGPVIASQVPVTAAFRFITVDVTPAVEAWIEGRANHGFAIVAVSRTEFAFDSKETAATSQPAPSSASP